MFRNYEIRRYDFLSLIFIIALSIIGFFSISSATQNETVQFLSTAQKQLLGFAIGFIIMVVISMIDYHFTSKLAIAIYVLNIFLLVLVLFAGKQVNGSRRWLALGSFTLQPSEFSKFFMVVVMATYFNHFKEKINRPLIILGSALIMALPTFLIAIETDLSTALVMIFIYAIMIFLAGLSYKYIVGVIVVMIPLSVAFFWYIQQPGQILLEDYQLSRIEGLLNPDEADSSSVMQSENSVQAIGSGQLFGKGLYQGKLNQYDYLPESQTDFIFSIIGEELGFIGCCVVLFLLFALMFRVLYISKDSKDLMGKLMGVGFAAVIAFHTFINVGVATNIVPNTGLPLPFVSYGLSSLWANMFLLGMVLNLSMQRKSTY